MSDLTFAATPRGEWARAAFLYAAIGGIVAFAWLGSSDVVSMEGIVADGARYIERTGRIWVPHLYGEPYNYKPPLVYWMALASFRMFGVENEWTLRLPIALCGFLSGGAILALLGGLIGPLRAAVCGIAAVSGMIVIQKSRLAEFDTPLALGVGIATCCALRVLVGGRGGWWLWPLAYLGLAFGLLAKGIPALMVFGPGLLAAAFWLKRVRELFGAAHLLSVGLFLAIATYYVLAVRSEFGLHAFAQTFSEAGTRGASWAPLAVLVTLAKPAIIAVIFLPWSPMLLFAVDRGWHAALDEPRRQVLSAALAFLGAAVLAFMAVPTHETRYYVPLMTSLGLVAGIVATSEPIGPERWPRLRLVAARLTAGGVGIVAVVFSGMAIKEILRDAEFEGTWLGIGLLAASGCVAIAFAARGGFGSVQRESSTHDVSTMMIAAAICAWGFVTLYDSPKRAADRSLHAVATAFAGHVSRGERIWVDFDDDHSSLVFYLGCEARWFRRREGWPAADERLIVYRDRKVDQLAELEAAVPGRVERIADAGQRDWVFTLCRIRAEE